MRISKFKQSCLLLEEGDARILIDPGGITTADYGLGDFGELDAVLFTHRHFDHCDEELVGPLSERGIPVYGNADVIEKLSGHEVTEVNDGRTFEVAGLEITPRDLPHVEMVDGSAGPPNTGYVVDGRLFHPGDGAQLPGLEVDVLALPIAGPSISFRDAYRFLGSTGADTAIPIHFDFFMASPERFAEFCDIAEVLIIEDGDTAEI